MLPFEKIKNISNYLPKINIATHEKVNILTTYHDKFFIEMIISFNLHKEKYTKITSKTLLMLMMLRKNLQFLIYFMYFSFADSSDRRWIGMWWGGFLICGASLIVISVPFFFFPKEIKVQKMINHCKLFFRNYLLIHRN